MQEEIAVQCTWLRVLYRVALQWLWKLQAPLAQEQMHQEVDYGMIRYGMVQYSTVWYAIVLYGQSTFLHDYWVWS
jgi:hypothetical protein